MAAIFLRRSNHAYLQSSGNLAPLDQYRFQGYHRSEKRSQSLANGYGKEITSKKLSPHNHIQGHH